jgi:hypothetical protein
VSLYLLVGAGDGGIVITKPRIYECLMLLMARKVRTMQPGHWFCSSRPAQDRDHEKDSGNH